MTYNNWKLRKTILASDGCNWFKVHALILVDAIDWNTGIKEITGPKHWENWLTGVAERYSVKPDELDNGEMVEPWKVLGVVASDMIHAGWAVKDKESEAFKLVNDE